MAAALKDVSIHHAAKFGGGSGSEVGSFVRRSHGRSEDSAAASVNFKGGLVTLQQILRLVSSWLNHET